MRGRKATALERSAPLQRRLAKDGNEGNACQRGSQHGGRGAGRRTRGAGRPRPWDGAPPGDDPGDDPRPGDDARLEGAARPGPLRGKATGTMLEPGWSDQLKNECAVIAWLGRSLDISSISRGWSLA